MSHYPDERAAEQAASGTKEQQPAVGVDELSPPFPVPKTIISQYLLFFLLCFFDWRLAMVFWLVATTNCLLASLLYRLIQAVEHGNSVRGR